MRRLAPLVLFVALGCSNHFQQKLFVAPDLELNAIAVYPFGFRWPESAYRSFELSQRLIDTALEKVGDRVLVFGPSEFRVYRPLDDNAWAASNLVSLFPAYNLSAHKAAVLRPWAEQRRFQSQRETTDAKGKALGAKTVVEITYIGHVEIIHPSTRQVVVEEVGQVQVDPFADHTDDPDPVPELTQLMKSLTAEALSAVDDHLKARSEPLPLDLKYELVPKEIYAYAEEGKPNLETELQKADPLEADVVRLTRVRYANPKITDAEASKLLKLPGGLYITASGKGSKVKPGDLIHLIDGRPALPQTLYRARFENGAQAHIQRASGELQELPFP